MPRSVLFCLRPFVSICVVLSMLLPGAGIFVPDLAKAQSTPTEPTTETPKVVPTPFPQADWPESPAARHPPYLSSTIPLPAPDVTEIDPVANGAMLTAATIEQTRVTEVDTEAGKTGVVTGAATATLNDRTVRRPGMSMEATRAGASLTNGR